ncbi:MAG TPA: hypothetical protein VME41_05470 [Stellaceae bacterium]|nr:hypothetical protein [Stellaceae bacterium]
MNNRCFWIIPEAMPAVAKPIERNKWETAIRCLEVALHPNTGNDEVIAAVNGFRRTAAGTPLREVCAAFGAGVAHEPAFDAAARRRTLDRLRQENRDITEKLEAEQGARMRDAERLRLLTERVRQLQETLDAASLSHAEHLQETVGQIANLEKARRAARDEAADTIRQFAEYRLTQANILERANRENAALRRALDRARREVGALRTTAPKFGNVLAAALNGEPDGAMDHPAPASQPVDAAAARSPAESGVWIA